MQSRNGASQHPKAQDLGTVLMIAFGDPPSDFRFAPKSGQIADVLGGPVWATDLSGRRFMAESLRGEDLRSTARDPLVGVTAITKPAPTALPMDQAQALFSRLSRPKHDHPLLRG